MIPHLTNSAGVGRFCNCFSRLLARICLCNSRCGPCRAGAFELPGRMFPGVLCQQLKYDYM